MQQMEHFANTGNAGHRRVEAVVQTLAALGGPTDSLAEVAHDARNMVTALGLYCDLLDEPGVLAVPFAHYSSELRLVAAASRRLVEKLAALDAQAEAETAGSSLGLALGDSPGNSLGNGMDTAAADGWAAARLPDPLLQRVPGRDLDPNPNRHPDRHLDWSLPATASTTAAAGARSSRWESVLAEPIADLGAELLANRNLLAALAGPGIAVSVDAGGETRPVRLTAEDLTRLLVNMVKNAAEAMPGGGRIRISLAGLAGQTGAAERLLLVIEDNGPGVAEELRGRIFESGFTTHPRHGAALSGWPATHHGLGLAITRSIVEAAGGRIAASNRTGATGARFEIELPVRGS
jgi:signal transduction histidine kinase